MFTRSITSTRWFLCCVAWLALVVGTAYPHAQAQSAMVREYSGPQGTVSGVITADTTWTKAASPYQITGNLMVERGATLTVEPGVEVQVANNTYLLVRGKLQALGTADNPIRFTATEPRPGAWQGLFVQGTTEANATATLDYVTIEYGGFGTQGANLLLTHAQATIQHSTFRQGASHGVLGTLGAAADISDTSFTNNGSYALGLGDASRESKLARLSASDNGTNAVAIGGNGGGITGAITWEAMGLPYIARSITVEPSGLLTVAPGVEVRFEPGAFLQVNGRIQADGTSQAPIIFTGSNQTPGSWNGITIRGLGQARANGNFRYVTIEYGGFGSSGGNLYVVNGTVHVSHSIIRRGGAAGVMLWTEASGSVIEASQIVDNAEWGIYSTDTRPGRAVMAPNNWWGSATGPTYIGPNGAPNCNPQGSGSKVNEYVAFKPFLVDPATDPGIVAPGAARILSVTPRRWYAPADGVTRVVVAITLRDGNGQTLPNRTVRLTSSHGTVVDGGITDGQGQALAYVTATTAGEAQLAAQLALTDQCETARSNTSTITFTPFDVNDLVPDAEAPYLNNGIKLAIEPPVQGVPNKIRAHLTNPNTFAVRVNATFSYAPYGLGQTFDPIGVVENYEIPAKSSAVLEVPWTPLVFGHFCLRLAYVAQQVGGTTVQSSYGNMIKMSDRNLQVRRANYREPWEDDSDEANNLDQTRNILGALDGVFDALEGADYVGFLIPDMLFEQIINFNLDTYQTASDSLAGRSGTPRDNQPLVRQQTLGVQQLVAVEDYRAFATPKTYSVPAVQSGNNISAARAAAANALMTASLDLRAKLEVAVISDRRYELAAAANDLEWASRQAAAALFYRKASGEAMQVFSSRLIDVLIVRKSENIPDQVLTAEQYRAYQDSLRSVGWRPEARRAAELLGMTDAELEAVRQRHLAKDPTKMVGNITARLSELATKMYKLGGMLIGPSIFPIGSTGGTGGLLAAPHADAVVPNLVRVYDTATEFVVGNPLTQTTTVDLRVRRLDLPEDWVVSVSPITATLQPGQTIAATVRITPGAATVQGTLPRVAVEGYAGTQLLGGVIVDVAVPRYELFDGKFRVYLPQIMR